MPTPKNITDLIAANDIRVVDLKFVDMPGTWQHFTIPVSELETGIWEEGIGFDGSSIRGFQQIQESDMNLFLDTSTALVDPACEIPTLSILCDIYDPVTKQRYNKDPRYIAHKAEEHLKATGIADTSYWGPELEFFTFDDIRFDSGQQAAYYYIDSDEGIWNSGRDEGGMNLGYKVRNKEGYFPVPPMDSQQDLRTEMILKMIDAGIEIERQHHEVATAGQAEIDFRFGTSL